VKTAFFQEFTLKSPLFLTAFVFFLKKVVDPFNGKWFNGVTTKKQPS
jgi:hypothetical protein